MKARLYNSPNFADGSVLTTSEIKKGGVEGELVTTVSGSRYFVEV